MSRAFWPGFGWRILAHKRHTTGVAKPSSYLEDGQVSLRSTDFDTPVEFDELVIDHWFHLEQMSDRHWWIGIGSHNEGSDYYHVGITIDGKKNVRVSFDKETD